MNTAKEFENFKNHLAECNTIQDLKYFAFLLKTEGVCLNSHQRSYLWRCWSQKKKQLFCREISNSRRC